MKFEYDKMDDMRECVAFIDDEGDLCVKDLTGKAVYLCKNGTAFEMDADDFRGVLGFNLNAHRFYPGDKITITF